ncbi:thioredoxin family protein [bacterium]|nr:thioredoxin family protein [bacterium]
MTLTRTALIAVAACSLFAGAASAKATIGQAAPGFTLTSAEGKEVSLADYSGKTVILEWTNHDCPFVKKHYGSGNMQDLQAAYTGDDTVWLSIISSAPGKQGHVSPEKARELTTSRGAKPTHVLFDPTGEVGRSYGAKTTPHMYVIDDAGTLLAYNGAIDSIPSANPADIGKAKNYVKTAMTALAAGEKPNPATTKPYGCSVKY